MKQIFSFKIFDQYVPFDIFPVVELCDFIKNANPNSFFYRILKTLNAKIPGLIHNCPYKAKDFQVNNLYISKSDLASWIRGEYKLMYRFYDDQDSRILRVTAMGVINQYS